jgi:hypothetical protein
LVHFNTKVLGYCKSRTTQDAPPTVDAGLRARERAQLELALLTPPDSYVQRVEGVEVALKQKRWCTTCCTCWRCSKRRCRGILGAKRVAGVVYVDVAAQQKGSHLCRLSRARSSALSKVRPGKVFITFSSASRLNSWLLVPQEKKRPIVVPVDDYNLGDSVDGGSKRGPSARSERR